MIEDRLLTGQANQQQSWDGIAVLMALIVIGLAPMCAAFALQSQYVTVLDHFPKNLWFLNPGFFLSIGDLFVPMILMVPAVAARRMGLAEGYGVMIGSWILAGLIAFLAELFLGTDFTQGYYPEWRVLWTSLGALMLAQAVAVFASWRGGITLPITSGLALFFLLLLWRDLDDKGTSWDLIGQYGAHYVLVVVAALIIAPLYILARGK